MNSARTAVDTGTISSTIDDPARGAHQSNEETFISNTFPKMNETKNYATWLKSRRLLANKTRESKRSERLLCISKNINDCLAFATPTLSYALLVLMPASLHFKLSLGDQNPRRAQPVLCLPITSLSPSPLCSDATRFPGCPLNVPPLPLVVLMKPFTPWQPGSSRSVVLTRLPPVAEGNVETLCPEQMSLLPNFHFITLCSCSVPYCLLSKCLLLLHLVNCFIYFVSLYFIFILVSYLILL